MHRTHTVDIRSRLTYTEPTDMRESRLTCTCLSYLSGDGIPCECLLGFQGFPVHVYRDSRDSLCMSIGIPGIPCACLSGFPTVHMCYVCVLCMSIVNMCSVHVSRDPDTHAHNTSVHVYREYVFCACLSGIPIHMHTTHLCMSLVNLTDMQRTQIPDRHAQNTYIAHMHSRHTQSKYTRHIWGGFG